MLSAEQNGMVALYTSHFYLWHLPYSPPYTHLTLTSCKLVKVNHVANALKGVFTYEEKYIILFTYECLMYCNFIFLISSSNRCIATLLLTHHICSFYRHGYSIAFSWVLPPPLTRTTASPGQNQCLFCWVVQVQERDVRVPSSVNRLSKIPLMSVS